MQLKAHQTSLQQCMLTVQHLPDNCSLMLLQAVTNFATTANGVLASTFLLYSVGLGAGAIPTAGALNWVLKDGLGQMGTLLFGKAIAHNFDIHSKTWYFMSFLLLSTATGEWLLRFDEASRGGHLIGIWTGHRWDMCGLLYVWV